MILEELVVRMRTEVVSFSFLKKNGEIRKAKGTLRMDMCPTIEGGGRPTPNHLQLYFDVEKGSWRSFEKERFIEMY
jgi:hypothetical protein